MSVELRKDDTWPPINATLKQAGSAINLDSVSELKFRMESEGGTEIVNSTAAIITSSLGEVRYEWSSADTDTVGRYEGEFKVTFSSGKTATIPNTAYIPIYITDH